MELTRSSGLQVPIARLDTIASARPTYLVSGQYTILHVELRSHKVILVLDHFAMLHIDAQSS